MSMKVGKKPLILKDCGHCFSPWISLGSCQSSKLEIKKNQAHLILLFQAVNTLDARGIF